MPDKLYTTKAVILRTVKYGETSLIVTSLTETFGLQSYLINGVRKATKKSAGQSMFFQPGAILDLVVYHNELKQLNRIKEFRWGYLYQHIFSDIKKNTVALFMVELLTKCTKQPENNPDLFQFVEDCLMHLDIGGDSITANFPLFFALHLPVFMGLKMNDNYSEKNIYLDMQDGLFKKEQPDHPHFLDETSSGITAELLKVMQPEELNEIKLNQTIRRQLLHQYEDYYSLHIQGFGTLKTLPVLKEILN